MIAMAKRRAAFIDRDGVINRETGYVFQIDEFQLLPGVVDGLQRLQDAGYVLVLVTNQAGIARGFYTQKHFERLSEYLRNLLWVDGISFAGIYHCPHHPDGVVESYRVACNCRKPAPGMLLRAAEELKLDLAASVIIGDKRSDIEAGRAAGVGCNIIVRSGHPLTAEDAQFADICLPDLAAAARAITSP